MSTEAAHKSRWETFEAVFGIPFLAGVALQFAVPVSLPGGFVTPASVLVGVVLVVVGAALVALARRELTRSGQPTGPGLPTGKVVTTGVFSISRNPIYLGGVCAMVGLALAVDLPWALLLYLPGLVACHHVLIVPEERYLSARFGEEYEAYAASVHRWVGRDRRVG